MMGVATSAKDEEFAVMLVTQYVAYLKSKRIVQSHSRPGHSFPQRVRSRQLGSPPGFPGRVEDLENRRVLDGHLSIAIGKVLTRYTAGKAATTPHRAANSTNPYVTFSHAVNTH